MAFWQNHQLSRLFNNLPLRAVLIVPFVVQITFAVGLTGWISWRNGQQAVNDLAEQLRFEVTLRIDQKLDTLLQIPPKINHLNQNALRLGYLSTTDLEQMYRHFFTQAQEFEQAGGIFFGRPDGEFIGNALFNPNNPHQLMVAGAATEGAIRFYDVDAQGHPVRLQTVTPGFDPRQRPWYKAAMATGTTTWGEIFPYHAYTLLALPIATPIYDSEGALLGVFGNNFFLDRISEFLQGLKVGQTGQTYIIERNGNIVASSTLPQPFRVENGVTYRLNILEIEDPLLVASAELISDRHQQFSAIQEPVQLDFVYQKERYFLQVSPFEDQFGLDWLIVVMMPESDFMAQINANTRNSILLCLAALGVAMVSGWLTSRWIMRSVGQLMGASAAIAQGELSQAIEPGRLRELGILAETFNEMSQRLQASFAALQTAHNNLKESEEKFRSFAANSDSVLWIFDRFQRRFIYISPACRSLWGCDESILLDQPRQLLHRVLREDRPTLLKALRQVGQTHSFVVDYRIVHPDGTVRWIRDRAFVLDNGQEQSPWLGGIAEDITERKHFEQALTQSEAQYRLLAENMSDLVCLHTPTGEYLYVSSSVQNLLGYQPSDLMGHNHFDLIHPDDCDRIHQEALQLSDGIALPLTYRIRKQAGDYRWFETVARGVFNSKGELFQLQTTSRDVTEKMRLQRQLEYDAFHDALTGLPNRNLLMERLNFAIERIHHHDDYQFAVLFLDLDHFKVINDSLGHLAGDEVLIDVAQKLRDMMRSNDLVARLGGDEFVILMEKIHGLHEVLELVERIFERFQDPVAINYQQTLIRASIGIVVGTIRYQKAMDLIRDADTAMYRAKEKGRACYEIFDPTMHVQALARLELESNLRHAIEQNQLFMCYQPIISFKTHQLKSFEALIRWQHPQRGIISPAEFIPVAEETQLIVPMSLWLMKDVAGQIKAWQQDPAFPREITESLRVSINISVVHLQQKQFIEQVDQVLQETGVSGKHFIFEITESILIQNVEDIIQIFRCLRDRAIDITIDDFGTGYSSLSYLCDLPITSLKIDKSFVGRMIQSSQNRRVVETILSLTQQLELFSVAEGIETIEQFNLLKTLGCHYAQGYLFGRPVRSPIASQWLTHAPLPLLDSL
ncbi:EAL domain-containing protein [Spirulina subsalsa FACHB-351]|uniref:EAL domain-containing protein n=1 Tax=Spirulina subsalsa FACHB-351 TaxID=234711 RepID=A0ABT3LAQ3_9CYAN|nr:EAL domain-containing protein [Spirulina subsalsa]MCW6038184.1 EAL domain-containing protein [Spirulina subsalsa FACHB-351]